jgi:DNA mismatch repair protein MutS2
VLEYYKIIDMLKSYCVSSLGKALAEKVVPMYEKNKIEKFQMETQEALQIRIKRGSPPIGEIYEMKSKVKRAEIGGVLSPKSLLEVSRNLSVARKLKGYLRHDSEDRESKYINIEKYISELVIDKKLEEEIDIAIISEEEISDLASSKLRSIRKGMLQKQDNIRQKLDSMVHSTHYDKYLQDALVTIRGDRYCLPVKQEHKKKIPGMIHDQSSSGATVFIEPMAVVQMNNELRELAIEEKKEIERILRAFTERVAEIGSGIISNQKNLRKLDLIFAKGRLAIEMNAFMPKFSDCGELNLKKARHPMIDSKEVVANDIFLGKKFDTLVITGPNTGGKTVTLKTIGLLCMMAQSGLHIPTKEGSIVPIYREIFADIGDEQSIEQSLSTFSSHMTNIVEIFEKVKPGDLVLYNACPILVERK